MRILMISVFLLSLTGCASVIYMPTSTGQRPESRGKLWGGRVGLDLRNATSVTIIDDISTNPVTRNSIEVGSDEDIVGESVGLGLFAGSNLDLNLGLLERLDIYYVQAFGARYMFLGKTGELGWRATGFFGGYNSTQTASAVFGTTKAARVGTKGYEYGVSGGYRWKDNAMVYLTIADRSGDAEIIVYETNTGVNVEQERYNDEYDHYIASVGVVLGTSWYLNLEVSANMIEWRGQNSAGNGISDSATEGAFSIGGGYQW